MLAGIIDMIKQNNEKKKKNWHSSAAYSRRCQAFLQKKLTTKSC